MGAGSLPNMPGAIATPIRRCCSKRSGNWSARSKTQPATNIADSVDQIRFDVVEMAAAIAQTKREIAAIRPDGEQQGHAGVVADELDAIVESTEKATQDILEATEQIQEIAWSIREEGVRDDVCDELDKLVTEIYTASSFQDLHRSAHLQGGFRTRISEGTP